MGYVNNTYNKKTNKYTFKAENPTYTKLSELYKKNGSDATYVLRALYIADKGEIPHPVAVTDPNIFVDLPAFLLDAVKDYRADNTLTDLINKGLVAFKIYEFESVKYGKKTCYSIDLLDIEPDKDDLDVPFEIK